MTIPRVGTQFLSEYPIGTVLFRRSDQLLCIGVSRVGRLLEATTDATGGVAVLINVCVTHVAPVTTMLAVVCFPLGLVSGNRGGV